MASGLRVRSAVDDPSGYAIAQTIKTKVSGLQQSVTNVQTANNVLNVADGALATIQSVLQRIKSLAVESASDFESDADKSRIQDEIDQLLDEINKVSSTTEFNGLKLLDGSFDASPGAQWSIQQVASPAAAITTTTLGATVSNADGLGNPGPLITFDNAAEPAGAFLPSFMVFTVTGYSDNAIDPDSGEAMGASVYLQFQAYSSDPQFGGAPLMTDTTAVPINYGQIVDTTYSTPGSWDGYPPLTLLNFTVSNLTEADVGATMAFVTTGAVAPGMGTPLYVNDGGDEGTVVPISLPSMSTTALNLGGISVLAPNTVGVYDTPLGASSSNQMAEYDAQSRVDAALEKIGSVRAQVGAQTVALNESADDDNLAIENQTASMSQITDANVPQVSTDFVKQQILGSVGYSVLAAIQTDAALVTQLFTQSTTASAAAA